MIGFFIFRFVSWNQKKISCSLHSILALNPGSDVGSPCQGSTEGAKDVVPFDPRSRCNGTRFLLKETRLVARVGTDGQEGKGQHSQNTRGHLGHDGSKDLRGWVFTLPEGIFRAQGSCRSLGDKGRSADLRDRSKGRDGGDDQGADNETELGHFGR